MSKSHEKDIRNTERNKDEEDLTKETVNAGAESPPEEVESLTPEEEARRESSEWRDKYLRQLAEFNNFRKRQRQESEMLGQIVRESLIVSLLPVKDDFDRMLKENIKPDDAFVKGVELIHNKLNAFFDAQHVQAMEGRGTDFDPDRHDALMMQPTEDFPAGTILDVITPGYVMGDRVIRHAQVVVSTEPESAAESGTNDSTETSEEA
ncbi:nucleotide exchange factor GrpE [bacterium]|nr:nucleotide exchange factor GrpE [bacterium]